MQTVDKHTHTHETKQDEERMRADDEDDEKDDNDDPDEPAQVERRLNRDFRSPKKVVERRHLDTQFARWHAFDARTRLRGEQQTKKRWQTHDDGCDGSQTAMQTRRCSAKEVIRLNHQNIGIFFVDRRIDEIERVIGKRRHFTCKWSDRRRDTVRKRAKLEVQTKCLIWFFWWCCRKERNERKKKMRD